MIVNCFEREEIVFSKEGSWLQRMEQRPSYRRQGHFRQRGLYCQQPAAADRLPDLSSVLRYQVGLGLSKLSDRIQYRKGYQVCRLDEMVFPDRFTNPDPLYSDSGIDVKPHPFIRILLRFQKKEENLTILFKNTCFIFS